MRPFLERRHLPVAHLVEDPAGILVAEVVDAAALPVAERRSVVAASSGVNGSACRLVKMLSRPNMVMNHGRPAAGRLRPAGDGRREPQRREVDEAAPVGRLERVLVALEPRCVGEPALEAQLHVRRPASSARVLRPDVRPPAPGAVTTSSSVVQCRAARSAP